MSEEIKLFIGMEETNINDFRSKCCNALLSVEPLCKIVCGICCKDASSVDNHYYSEPTIKVSELREWCEEVLEDVRFNKDQCDNYSDGWYACEHMAKELLTKFCGGV